MYVSDFLSRFFTDHNNQEPIPFLTDTEILTGNQYMIYLDSKCKNNYVTNHVLCTDHAFPVTRLIDSLFKTVKSNILTGNKSKRNHAGFVSTATPTAQAAPSYISTTQG